MRGSGEAQPQHVKKAATINHDRKPEEYAMTKNLNMKLIAAAFLAASAVAMFSMGSAKASMTAELQNCKTNSRSNTVHCCQNIVGQNLPYWMRESGRNCATSVSCVGTKKIADSIPGVAAIASPKKKKTYCYIAIMQTPKDGGNNQPPPPTTNKNPNNNPTGGVAGKP
jgi:hypothetical protein